jgi:hypothetical protein
MGRFLELDSLDNTSIVAATAVGSYTATADIDVYCTLYAQGLAGGGDYIYYVTVTPSGLSEGEGLKTTQTLGATTYVLFAQTIPVSLRNGDVLKVYLDGLAGDTTTPDMRVNFYESPSVQPTTAGRTLDITSTGAAGIDWANVENPTSTVGLSGTTVGTATALGTGAVSAAAVATGAIDADALAADAGTELGTAIWASATRTLTQSAAAVTAAVEGATITIRRGDTLSAALTGLASNTGYVSIDFVVKKSPDDLDNDAILWIRKNASGLTDGLQRLNGAALVSPVVAGDGTITVVSSTALTMALAARASDDLAVADDLYYEIQLITASAVTTLTSGICNITADIVRAIA